MRRANGPPWCGRITVRRPTQFRQNSGFTEGVNVNGLCGGRGWRRGHPMVEPGAPGVVILRLPFSLSASCCQSGSRRNSPRSARRLAGMAPMSMKWGHHSGPSIIDVRSHSCPCARRKREPMRELNAETRNNLINSMGNGGRGWIRTNVGVRQRIYSPPPLATRAPLRTQSGRTTAYWRRCQRTLS